MAGGRQQMTSAPFLPLYASLQRVGPGPAVSPAERRRGGVKPIDAAQARRLPKTFLVLFETRIRVLHELFISYSWHSKQLSVGLNR